jgi:hypothetical protein
MIKEKELIDSGYSVLSKGGWIRLSPDIVPHDWVDICKDFGVDPECHELILAVCGVKQINDGLNIEA